MSEDIPYQVFISFKNTDSEGNITRDHDIAKELYDRLTAEGICTFFSEASIPEEGSSSYMKVINKALEEATIMILIGTKREHILSRWVAQEWESFIGDINSNIKTNGDFLLFIDDMTVRDIPALLRNQQMIQFSEGYDAVTHFVVNHLKKTNNLSITGATSSGNILGRSFPLLDRPVTSINKKAFASKAELEKLCEAIEKMRQPEFKDMLKEAHRRAYAGLTALSSESYATWVLLTSAICAIDPDGDFTKYDFICAKEILSNISECDYGYEYEGNYD